MSNKAIPVALLALALEVASVLTPGSARYSFAQSANKGAPTTNQWDARFYNPKPAADDFVLPMPCGGAMAFRRIETPTGTGALDDRPVTFGEADPDTNYSDFVRADYIAGGFAENGKQFYYLAKYKMTADQTKALRGSDCAGPSLPGRLPEVGLSWFDAVELAERYNEWLYKNAPDKVPGVDQTKGFIRVPTEAEWEYAARGGSAVSEAEFRGRLFPMAEDVSHYAWFQGTRSAAGALHAIGLLSPNPLGLYDIIGDADEIVLEPYRLNKVGRLHGEAGGFTVKGGDFRTAEERLRSSMRIELPHFDPRTGQPNRLATVGVRFAIAAPAIPSLQSTSRLRVAFEELSGRQTQLADTPLELLNQITEETVDPNLKRGLGSVANLLREEARERKEFAERAVNASIGSGAILGRALRDIDSRIRAVTLLVDDAKKRQQQGFSGAAKDVAEFSQGLDNQREAMRITLDAYARLVEQVGNDFAAPLIDTQLVVLADEYSGQKLSTLSKFAKLFADHAKGYGQSKQMEKDEWLRQLTK